MIKINNHQPNKSGWWFEKYESNWESSPNAGEHKQYLSCHHLEIQSYIIPKHRHPGEIPPGGEFSRCLIVRIFSNKCYADCIIFPKDRDKQ